MLSRNWPPPRRSKMSSVDTSWLRMDSDGNLMMIVGVAVLHKPVDIDQFKQILENKFLVYSRFRCRVVTDMAGSWWQEDQIDLEDHVIEVRLPRPDSTSRSNKAALQHLVGKLAAASLDPHKPLWQMHLVDGYIGEDGKTRQALIIRIHHCIGDGIALVGVFMSMFAASPHAPEAAAPRDRIEPPNENPWRQILLPVAAAGARAIGRSASALKQGLGMLDDPEEMANKIAEIGHVAGQFALDALKLSMMSEDSDTRLKGRPCGRKHVAWSEPMSLGEVKVIGKALDCSINDVLMSCVAGSIGSYLRFKGDPVAHGCEIRVMVPVNLRKPGSRQKLGNAFGLVPLLLPVGIENPVRRLIEVRHRMGELKGSYTALVAMSILGVLGAAPKTVQNEIQGYFSSKATAVMSNVPGPQKPLYLAESKLDQVMFWVPQSGDIGVGVSILSYNGGVQFGVVTDDALVNDPDAIISRFAPEFEKLLMLVLMSDAW